jgi:hypothetical protein
MQIDTRGRRAFILLPVAALCLAACNPTFNWRESRLGETALLGLMPCKPDTVSREVPFVHGASARLTVASCEVGELTFALSTADVGEARLAAASLDQWRQVVTQHWQLKPGQTLVPMKLERADPHVLRWKAQGLAGAQTLSVEVAMFSSGSQLYQAAIIAKSAQTTSPDISETFFGGLKLQ